MMLSKSKIKIISEKFLNAGFFHIFGTSILNKIFGLLTNVILVRIISKGEYGYYSYAYNIITIILIFSDLGTRSSRLQFCCETEDENERASITNFLVKVGSFSNVVFGLVTFLYASFFSLPLSGAKLILQSLSLYTLFQFFYDQETYSFRIKKDNKKYALLTCLHSAGHFVFSCLFAFCLGGVGIVFGNYIAFTIPLIVGAIFLNKSKPVIETKSEKYGLSKDLKTTIIKYGLLIVLTNSVSSVLNYFDTFLVGTIIENEEILADYKVATIIPNALNFIPSACYTFIYPYFVAQKDNYEWIKKHTIQMQLLLSVPCAFISIGGFLLASPIIKIVFGSEYTTAIPVFRILILTFFISCIFRSIFGNVLVMMHRVKANFWLSSIECVVNIVLDVIFIKHYGSVGAAYATFLITAFSSLISGIYFFTLLNTKMKKRSNI